MAIILNIKQNQLLSQNKTGRIQFWQIDGYELTLLHELSKTAIIGFCCMVLYNTNMILCSGLESTMECYSIETLKKIKVFDPRPILNLGELMIIKSIKNYIFCGYESNTIVVWNEDRIVSLYNFPDLEGLLALDVDHTVAKGVCAGTTDMINTFCIVDDELVFDKSIKITNPGVNTLKLRPDNKIVAAACWDLNVRLFSWKSMKLLAVLDSHSTGVISLVYSELSIKFWKTTYMLAVANKDSKITLWDVYNK